MGDFILKNKNVYLLALLFLVCILSISAISATENTTNKDVISANNNKDSNLETNIQYDDISNSKDNVELKEEENNNKDKVSESGTDKTTESNAELTFTDLNNLINNNTNSTIYLSNNYKYNSDSDSSYKSGIAISRNLIIYGNGVTIDGAGTATIFHVTNSKSAVEYYNITFINANGDPGGAIYRGNAYNCTFTQNAGNIGGAIYKGNAYNCIFTGNQGNYGGAIMYGDAYNCTFNGNFAYQGGGAIYEGNAYNCIFTENEGGPFGGAINQGNATNCKFINNTAYNAGAIWRGEASYCTFTQNHANQDGGAIYEGNAYNCTFTNNSAVCGGAISETNAINCTFTQNQVTVDGGAIYLGDATQCTFEYNSAEKSGGAIWKGSAYNCTFTQNQATEDNGGAMHTGNAINCTFSKNKANQEGGAIYNGTAINCLFAENEAAIYGGALRYANAYNSTFLKNTAKKNGGAINQGNATNCIFIQNQATEKGGALDHANAYNCTFKGNTAKNGGAIYEGTACLCLFYGDSINNTNITRVTINVLNYTSTYQSGEKLQFNITANNMVFNGFNTTINIYKHVQLIKTVYGLSGEGWIVDLEPGKYTVVLSLTDYPDEILSIATIDVSKGKTTVVIDPIIDVVVGKEVIINYTTNSNGTVTILVNGTPINDVKFTPTQAGTYNVTIHVAENDYYTAAYNETTFIAVKTNTTVEIKPIGDVVVGDEVIINYTTNSNGTVIIKVNGEVISDGNFTPTKTGTYNLTVEIAENDYYTAGFNQTTFTVGKLASKIIVSPVTTTYNVGKNLLITLKDENGKPIVNSTVTVNLGSSKIYTTNVNGQVKIIVAKLTPKTYNAKITYAGSDIFNGSITSVKVTVKKATPKITAKAASYKLKVKTKKYSVTFKDNKNKALINTKVTLEINGKTYTAKTNKKGQGVFKITNLKKKGKYTGVITVPANKYYNKITKKVKITVKP